jgi:hypothetical protein
MVPFNGHYDGRAITPDEQVEIPVNVPLRVTIEPATAAGITTVDGKRLLDLARRCAIEGPKDLAGRHDHYAHGKPVE